MSNSTSKKIEGYIKSTRWKRRAERVRRKLERAEKTRKAKPSAESRSVSGTRRAATAEEGGRVVP